MFQDRLPKKWVTVRGNSILTRFSCVNAEYPQLPVIFIPGLALSGKSMVPAAYETAFRYPVFIPDYPGLGDSTKTKRVRDLLSLARFTREWMFTLGIEKAVFVGSSYGAQIAAELALRYPSLVYGLVLIGPTVDPKRRTLRQQLWSRLLDSRNESTDQFSILFSDYLKCGLRQIFGALQHAMKDSIEDKLAVLNCPVLIVRGEKDPIVPHRWAKEAASLCRGELAVVPGKGHTLNFNAGRETAALLEKFIERHGFLKKPELLRKAG